MARPDPALLDPARYPFTCDIATRFGDLDVNLHINNVAFAQVCEEARVRFHHASGYHAALQGGSAMVASFKIDFLGEGYHPQPLTVHVAPLRLGTTSYALAQLIRQDDRTVAFAEAVLVYVQNGAPAPIPDPFRESVQPWMLRQ